MKKTILLAIFAIVIFSECTKNTTPAILPAYAYLEVIDLRPDTIPVNILINQNLMTKGSISYPFLITSSPVSPDSISINISRYTNVSPLLLQTTYKTTADSFYSMVIGDSMGSFKYVINHVSANTLTLSGPIGIRFINAVPNCNYDLKVNNQFIYYNKQYFTRDLLLNNFAVVDSLKDTVFVFKTGTDSMISYVPITNTISNGYYTFSVNGVAGDSTFKAVQLDMFRGY